MPLTQADEFSPYMFDPETRSFVFYDSTGHAIAIDAVILAELMMRHADEQLMIASLNRRGYRVQKKKLGVFLDKWVEA